MKKYPAKLLMFGEYGLMFGAKALAIPFPKFAGYFAWIDANSPSDYQKNSAAELERFASWFATEEIASKMNFPLDLERLNADLKKGLYFESDVPLQYGVGSSGALCAALYDQYSSFSATAGFSPEFNPDLIPKLREDFITLESYFHGRSSGLDPLVAFLNRPVLVEDGKISLPELELHKQPWSVYLIDTEITSPTSPLVKLFIEKMEVDEFKDIFHQSYVPANDGATLAFMQNDADFFFSHLKELHDIQSEHLCEMIPDSCLEFIRELKSRGILVKLLGSGGGGFLLAFVPAGAVFPEKEKSFRIF
ncbi:mevalonate kinase family protein [Mangrovibacterium diazotrophicum]|nr:hypothetical protein [Mangrovibacterium diazotrophicum]